MVSTQWTSIKQLMMITVKSNQNDIEIYENLQDKRREKPINRLIKDENDKNKPGKTMKRIIKIKQLKTMKNY